MRLNLIPILIATLILSCQNQSNNANSDVSLISTDSLKAFEIMAQNFQAKYMAGSENCETIIEAFDKNVNMSEIQFGDGAMVFTYEMLKEFCPHLPKKDIIQTVTEQRLLSTELGYDYVSQLYLRKSLNDTIRETSSRIWKLENNKWKIIQMNSSLNQACD